MKTVSLLFFVLTSPAFASSGQIDFAVDCMIHDAHGKMLADFGKVGAQADGSYIENGTYTFGELTAKINLVPTSRDAPEVAGPVLKVCFQKGTAVTAKTEASANSAVDVALWEPSEDLFLHCEAAGK